MREDSRCPPKKCRTLATKVEQERAESEARFDKMLEWRLANRKNGEPMDSVSDKHAHEARDEPRHRSSDEIAADRAGENRFKPL